MKAIETKYHGPTNFRGSRVSARDMDKNHVILSWDYSLNSEENHRRAADELCLKMGWKGKLCGGSLQRSMVWVFCENESVD